ncbi:pentatricopeptide repeat-containing protein At2g17140 isoform X3 [Euphorbia lathyris]|uniref:pentatricopeptide repeat-containing protein At2g17140 isoform X3 n=1 Tax=Euphorbia lathyris TaxID=212925 RepID=UPI00331400E6
MDSTKLRRALLKNTQNPKLAWHLFKRILSLPISSTHHPSPSIPIIARILIRAKMFTELDHLQQLLLNSHFFQTLDPSLEHLVALLAKSGFLDKAISLFESVRYQFPVNPPSIYLYNALFKTCIKDNRLDFVSWLYKDLVVSGDLFDKMPDKGCTPNEFSFGILVRGYCRAGLTSKGLELLTQMRSLRFLPNRVVYNTLISSFCGDGKTHDAEKLVDMMREDGLVPDVVTFNCRISALCKNGKILEASRIFRDMQFDEGLGLPRPNVITYKLILLGFFKEGLLEEANTLVDSMKRNGHLMDLESYNIWLLGLVRSGKLLEAQLVLKEIIDIGMIPNIYSYNIIMDGLCKNGMLSGARMLMGLMVRNGISPDIVTYSTLLHGYCSKGMVREAHNVLHDMTRNHCFPNTYTCNILLHSLWKEGRTSEAEELLQKMNEKGYGVDTVTCNIVIDGLCSNGQLDKAVEIVSGMWIHGSAALGNLGNSFVGLVDNSNSRKKCLPDLITYSTIINGLCKAGRLDDAKKKFIEMKGKNLQPDSAVYDTFVHSFCREGKISSAFRVLKDMEKQGCNKTLQTYNSLILGLGSKNQIFEIYGLIDEMKEKGVSPNVYTYNHMLNCLCEGGRIKDAPSVLDEMLKKGISPNIYSFEILIKAFCRASNFKEAHEVFEIALNVCGHKEALYSLMFNELLLGGDVAEAKAIFETALDRSFCVGNFLYEDLIDRLCKDKKLEVANGVLHKLIDKGYQFDPASFMPVIDGFSKIGNKHESNELAERMMEMASETKMENKTHYARKSISSNKNKDGGNNWQTIVHRDDGSRIALKALTRVLKGWGQGNVSCLKQQKDEFLDYWDGSG